ncbi:MAG TPA: SDR family oxidoreductase [Burkholderiaceae bacterium]|jgi:NAD(P)-dependent dehydrogenase (short-subunit alcohol dehydrogenase family)|nr:SDR family oxidoreductase [Burkholderiaceae bacterium]
MKPVALVTGGSGGIGRAICEHLLAAGHRVHSLSREATDIDHPDLHSVQVDLADPVATREAAATVCAGEDVSVLVHSAGAMRPALLPDVKVDDLHALVDLHLTSLLILTQAVLPSMRRHAHGRIVLVSSRAALGLASRTSYAATKSGMFGMARTWALELGPDGITVNVVAPGPVVTDMFHEVIPRDAARMDQIAQAVPVRRLGQPADVARAVMFFAAPENGFVTGQTLYVCGGTSVGSITY